MVIFNSGSFQPVWTCFWSDLIAYPSLHYFLRNNFGPCTRLEVGGGVGMRVDTKADRSGPSLLRIGFLGSVCEKALSSARDGLLPRTMRKCTLWVQVLVQSPANTSKHITVEGTTLATLCLGYWPYQFIWRAASLP